MLLFQLKVTDISNMEDVQVAETSVIEDIEGLSDRDSILDIMERIGNFIMEFNSDKKGKVE